ncbi:MAG: efflux RND transporter periplasmic adaptor subunit [Deltaproteobacteria bacterium]
MKINKKLIIGIVIAFLVGAGFKLVSGMMPKKDSNEVVREISPKVGAIRIIISSTGTVLPKNRLQVKPPVNGRIDSILVKEGDKVKKGQTIGWLSSTERAALLDAAQGQGEEQLKYWQQVYKPIALVAPIDGEVIVATMQPGQAVTTADAALVLSDQLIVRAQVDETDIGKIREGQQASVSLDAYADQKIPATVDHIYHESQTVNNVTIYNVDLVPQTVPDFFRSGMNANCEFVQKGKEDALLIPLDAVQKSKDGNYVLVKGEGREPEKRPVTLGLSDDKNVEITQGLSEDDTVVVKSKKYTAPKSGSGGSSNPFMPNRPRGTGGGRAH